jgi:hypothetical protein
VRDFVHKTLHLDLYLDLLQVHAVPHIKHTGLLVTGVSQQDGARQAHEVCNILNVKFYDKCVAREVQWPDNSSDFLL